VMGQESGVNMYVGKYFLHIGWGISPCNFGRKYEKWKAKKEIYFLKRKKEDRLRKMESKEVEKYTQKDFTKRPKGGGENIIFGERGLKHRHLGRKLHTCMRSSGMSSQ
jgi:hypothetical protein